LAKFKIYKREYFILFHGIKIILMRFADFIERMYGFHKEGKKIIIHRGHRENGKFKCFRMAFFL
jgi:hypothetical protein